MTYGIASSDRDAAGAAPGGDETTRASVALCGSFHRDHARLKCEYEALVDAGCRVLSPMDIDWIAERDGFVLAEQELDEEPRSIEQAHLQAMRAADFVWLHAPEGYVGRSASMELGYAHALGLRVFARTLPDDVTLAGLVRRVDSVEAAMMEVASGGGAPALGVDALQRYYARAATSRGWAGEGARECLCLLTEELGELARAMRKEGDGSPAAGLEMADVQLYLVHLANIAGIDLGKAVVEKEHLNLVRFGPVLRHAA
jgi:NTP pyrophosphatase (non-canonical NTP hydrolase)